MRSLATSLLVALATALVPVSANAATIWKVRGRGFGHGVGMSQYGAYGYAQHGWTYDAILRHYYTGTDLGSKNPSMRVQVLVDTEPNSVAFDGATSVNGKAISSSKAYTVRRRASGGTAVYRGSTVVRRSTAGMLIKGGISVRLREGGSRLFRGYLYVSRVGGRLQVLNQLGLDNYVKGVVSGEMPSSWLPEALKVQAVAARSFAVANGAGTKVLYSDTRSQVYRGMSGESRTGNAAVTATKGQVVTYQGVAIVTYYFSTSGGRTENVENIFCPGTGGSCAEPYLKSVEDKYDAISPRHTWTFRFTPGNIGARLGVGSLKAVKVTQRGVSPRIVSARFRGKNGSLRIYDGSEIRSRLGTYDSWLRFYKISAQAAAAASAATTMHGAAGNSSVPTRVTAERHQRLTGSFVPGRAGATVKVQRRTSGAWVTVDTTTLRKGGAFAWTASHAGSYRAVAGGLSGPAVTLR